MLIGEAGKVARFDSSTSTLLALAHVLEGRELRNLGLLPGRLEPLAYAATAAINSLPVKARVGAYRLAARAGSVEPGSLGDLEAGEVAHWLVSHYRERRYPTVFIGSANGAATHIASALGAPWLPQTFLVAVRHPGLDPDAPEDFMKWARGPARLLLASNPDVRLHHMVDPAQDRPMLSKIAYFRLKRLRLGRSYERFLDRCLAPSGTIFTVECRLPWPTTTVAERHVFQFGGVGGLSPEDYLQGSPEISRFLRREGSPRTGWDPPPPDGMCEEAEWGFARRMNEDIERYAQTRGHRLRRIVFENPSDLSALQADLYRWWYRRLGRPACTLLVETFNLLQPYLALRGSAVPFWTVFNTRRDASEVLDYLRCRENPEFLYFIVLSHGIQSPGLMRGEEWERLAERLAAGGGLLGTDPHKYPWDFGTFIKHQRALRDALPPRFPLPPRLTLEEFDDFLDAHGGRYPEVTVTR